MALGVKVLRKVSRIFYVPLPRAPRLLPCFYGLWMCLVTYLLIALYMQGRQGRWMCMDPAQAHQETTMRVPLVVNPHRFKFLVTNEKACSERQDSKGELFVVLLVKCAPTERLDRDQIRQTWGAVKEVYNRRVLTMFLIGLLPRGHPYEDPLAEEMALHHDFIQEDFLDRYRNLTYKNLMGLRWVSQYCQNARYVFSVDADMMINIATLVQRLEVMPKTGFAEGHLRKHLLPVRDPKNKWYVPESMYPHATYPPFLNGACYAMSYDVAVLVYYTSQYVPFLDLDDVFVGITMKKAGVVPGFAPYYEQFNKNRTQALIQGIGIGIQHNRKSLNTRMLQVWHNVVGSRIYSHKKVHSNETKE